jgi:uncharacterized Zn-binding protein involved in type VI secretion
MRLRVFLLVAAIAVSHVAGLRAQNATPAGAIVNGSPDVAVGGSPASRQGDAAKDGAPVAQGSPDVFINRRPAATAGAQTACGGAVVGGAPSVFVNGKPLARSGDATTGCAKK